MEIFRLCVHLYLLCGFLTIIYFVAIDYRGMTKEEFKKSYGYDDRYRNTPYWDIVGVLSFLTAYVISFVIVLARWPVMLIAIYKLSKEDEDEEN